MNSAAWKQLVPLLAVAIALRLGAGVYWQSRLPEQFGFGDSESYWTLGRAIAQGQPYRFGEQQAQIFRTPGYPILLAPIFLLGGEQPPVAWARTQSALFGTLTVAAVWWLGRELFDPRCGLIAAVMASLYPGAIAISAFVLSEAPFCLLMIIQLALWTVAWRAETLRRAGTIALVAGLVAGAATLVRPSWLLFTPAAALLALAIYAGRKRQACIGAAMLLGMIVIVTPWWLRNFRLSGHFVPTTLQVGASLYDGLNPQATGASNMDFVPRFLDALRRESPGQDDVELEIRLDRRLRGEALAWARDNPAPAVQLAGIKFLRVWNVWPNEAAFSRPAVRLAVVCTYVPILVLGAIGAVRTIRLGWPYVLCWLPAVYFSMLHVFFVSSIRYRQPAMLALIVLAAGAAAGWKRSSTSQSTVGRSAGGERPA